MMPSLRRVSRVGARLWSVFAVVVLAGCGEPRQDNIHFAVSPDGRQICFTANGQGGSDLYLLDLKTRAVRAVTRSSDFEMTPAFAPGGRHLVFAAAPAPGAASSVFICALDGTGRRQITRTPNVADMFPGFYGNGDRLAFARATLHRPYSMGGMTWDHWDVYTVALDGSNLRRLTQKQYIRMFGLTTSLSSSAVVFDADDTVNSRVYKVSTHPSAALITLTRGKNDFAPSFALDGSFLFYISDTAKPYDYDIWRIKPDGTDARQLTHAKSYLMNPRLSSDGRTLFYLSDPKREIRFTLYAADADGQHPRKIAASQLFDDPLHWKP